MENMGQKWVKDRVFWIYWKIWSIYFSEFGLWRNFIITAVFLHKSHTFEKSGSWDMGQNALDQSECSIDYFKLTIYLEQNDEKAWFLACWCRLIEIKSWLKNIGVGVVKKWVWSLWSQDTKIGCISRRNQWNKLALGMLIKI